jgi:hypothetical protein
MSKNREGQTGWSHCSTPARLCQATVCERSRKRTGGEGGRGRRWKKAPDRAWPWMRGFQEVVQSRRELSCLYLCHPESAASSGGLWETERASLLTGELSRCLFREHGLGWVFSCLSLHFFSRFCLCAIPHPTCLSISHLAIHLWVPFILASQEGQGSM